MIVIIIAFTGTVLAVYNLLTALWTVSNTYTQVAPAQSCANNMQHIKHLSHATCGVSRGTKGHDSSAINTFLMKENGVPASKALVCQCLLAAKFIETSTTKRVFLWYRSQSDTHLVCRFRMMFIWIKHVTKSSYHNQEFFGYWGRLEIGRRRIIFSVSCDITSWLEYAEEERVKCVRF